MEIITKNIGGNVVSVVLTDEAILALSELQGEGIDRNFLSGSYVRLLGAVIRRLTGDYKVEESAEVLRLIKTLLELSDLMQQLSAPEVIPAKVRTTVLCERKAE